MKNNNYSSTISSGFTLVELSIVLVIVGLLIGGLLVGQSLIAGSATQSVIKDLAQYDAAVTTFRSKYKQFPGDTNLLPIPGNNNGKIDIASAPTWYEYPNFWVHLSLGIGLKNQLGSAYQQISGATYPKTQCPALKIKKNPAMAPVCITTFASWGVNSFGYGYSNPSSLAYPAFIPAELYAIDNKIDDGVPRTGKVYHNLNIVAGDTCLNGTAYNISDGGFVCGAIFMQFGTITGLRN